MVHLDNTLWHCDVEHLIIHPEYPVFHQQTVLAGDGGEYRSGEEKTDKYLGQNFHLPPGDKVTAGPII